MNVPKSETLPPPPGVIGSLKAGFDTVAVHITAIFLPLVLDLLLWLGPHLSVEKLFQPMLSDIRSFGHANGVSASDLDQMIGIYKTVFHQFNLLSLLRTFPIGVSSLMSGLNPLATPLGTPTIVQVHSVFDVLGWIAILTLLGWLGGGFYFRWIASLVTPREEAIGVQVVLQSVFLSIMWMIASFVLGIPLFLVLYLLFAINPILGQGVLLFLGFLSMWLVVPLFFSAHGIFIRRQNVFASVISSLQMTRFTLPTSSLFVLSVILISIGLNFVWSIPPSDSWMALIGILGHAFITTALLAASFIYYRDMTGWLQTVFEKLKTRAATPQA
ncbi:MAG TPA: hypothetical protein VMT73_11235 [Anaerolineales bacterium]|nr:hypothetical protein [Anaerolineales bacterium]